MHQKGSCWACWKTYLGRPENEGLWAMCALGQGLSDAGHHEDALSAQEAELSLGRRLGASENHILVVKINLANTYAALGQMEKALSMARDVYSGRLKLSGEEHLDTLIAANNYADSLRILKRFKEAKALLRKSLPVARRVLGDSKEAMLMMRLLYARTLHKDPASTLDDLREAVATLEDTGRIARRVLGGSNPVTEGIDDELRAARAALDVRETQSSSGSA